MKRQESGKSKSKARALPRPFSLHWGDGQIVEEVTMRSEYHEPAIQLLEFENGDLEVRFCYFDLEGRFQRSPLIVGAAEVEGLREGLKHAPRLRQILRDLIE